MVYTFYFYIAHPCVWLVLANHISHFVQGTSSLSAKLLGEEAHESTLLFLSADKKVGMGDEDWEPSVSFFNRSSVPAASTLHSPVQHCSMIITALKILP